MTDSKSKLPEDESNHSDSNPVKETQPGSEETAAMPVPKNPQEKGLPQTDTVLGDFRLIRKLGKGGMAEVWLAEQESLKRNVALKLLRPTLTEDHTYVARFQTEAKAAAGLNHPNIVQVYTVGERNGQYFIAQEYVQGQTLKSFIQKKGALEVNVALAIMRQVASALQVANERGIVHRDIKPENIMLNRKGEAKVADFGLAQLQGGEQNLTQEGVTMGTPLYMSPEQVNGKKLDQRSDIYSFGITCYHMLAGRPPFEGENAVSVAVKHLHEPPKPLQEIRSDLPVALCKVIARMTSKKPEDRYDSAQAVLLDVRKIAKALKTGETVDHLVGSPENTNSSFPVKKPALVLPLLCLLVALCSAGMGFVMQKSVAEVDPDAIDSSIPKKDTAREQYKHAMLRYDDEDAFKAVIHRFPTDKVWTPKAHEQLAMMYLRNSSRHAEAREQLRILKTQYGPAEKAKAQIGEAYLSAIDGEYRAPSATLSQLDSEIQEHISGSWEQRVEDIREMIQQLEEKQKPAT
ncbi:serine/threonine protein kinase [Thalassoglobus sp.]|uniref:serine/threonine protein kinase n=1 Tax=Thalassoglobus sp. TaxID=2795869 RepID=UPI003AA986CA